MEEHVWISGAALGPERHGNTSTVCAARGSLTPAAHFITLNAFMGVFKANAGYLGNIINSEVFLDFFYKIPDGVVAV